MSAANIIEVQNLVKAFGMLPVLKKLNLNIERGQFVGLLGPNGSGKSTLLRLLAGLSKPSGGSIRIGGWDMPDEAAAVRAQIGMVSHKALLYENLTARENLEFFAKLYNLEQETLHDHIDELLRRVDLYKRSHSQVRTFSRGMQQRLSIARALLHRPDVLLLDEPYTGLDQDAGGILDGLLRDAQQSGHTIIMASHQMERVAALVDRVVILSRGQVAHDESPVNLSALELSALYAETTGAAARR